MEVLTALGAPAGPMGSHPLLMPTCAQSIRGYYQYYSTNLLGMGGILNFIFVQLFKMLNDNIEPN